MTILHHVQGFARRRIGADGVRFLSHNGFDGLIPGFGMGDDALEHIAICQDADDMRPFADNDGAVVVQIAHLLNGFAHGGIGCDKAEIGEVEVADGFGEELGFDAGSWHLQSSV